MIALKEKSCRTKFQRAWIQGREDILPQCLLGLIQEWENPLLYSYLWHSGNESGKAWSDEENSDEIGKEAQVSNYSVDKLGSEITALGAKVIYSQSDWFILINHDSPIPLISKYFFASPKYPLIHQVNWWEGLKHMNNIMFQFIPKIWELQAALFPFSYVGQRDRGTTHQGVVRNDQHSQCWGARNPGPAPQPAVRAAEKAPDQCPRAANPAAEIVPRQVGEPSPKWNTNFLETLILHMCVSQDSKWHQLI